MSSSDSSAAITDWPNVQALPAFQPRGPAVVLGKPRFEDGVLAELATKNGPEAAWVQAFAIHEVDAAKHVHGDFAVGLDLGDGTTYLAVDRFAVRTLCYRLHEGRLLFAERADALAVQDAEIDPQAIFDYLYFHVIPSPRTIFKNVFRLPPGHYALFRSGQLHIAPYWTPVFDEPSKGNFSDLRVEFLSHLRQSVKAQVDGTRVGCFLSGGTDSSTIAGVLGEVTAEPVRTYSIGFDASGYDEMEYSRIAARHFKTVHHEYYVTPDDLVRSIGDVAVSFDQPFGNSSVLPAYYCARIARESGVERILGGDGGDELFGGNSRYAKQRVFEDYNTLPAFLRKHIVEPLLIGNRLASVTPGVRKVVSYVTQAMVPMPERLESYNQIMRLGLTDVLTADFLNAVDPDSPSHQQRDVYRACRAGSLINRMLAYDWRYTLSETDLPKVVGATRLAGLAVGFPLLDDGLVEFSSRLPPQYKLRGVKLRWFFKEALRGFLPDAIIKKKKQGFGLPFGVWLVGHKPLFDLAQDSLRSLGTRGFVRADFIDALLKHRLQSHPGFYGEAVWILLILEQWLRRHAPSCKLR